jgi:peptide/nickel transport system substrate-binding protein
MLTYEAGTSIRRIVPYEKRVATGKGAIMARKHDTRRLSRSDFLKLSGAGLSGAVLVGVAGCGGSGEIQGGQGGGGAGGTNVFTWGQGGEPVALDPINVTDSESSKVNRQIFDPLLRFAPESTEVIPALATEVPKAENGGLSYTFKLRKNVKFHDGTPFNAEAVVFNFERWRFTDNPYHKGGGSQTSNFSYYSYFGGFDDDSIIEKVEALDDYTVRFTLNQHWAPFIPNIAISAMSMASPKAIKKDVEGFWKNPVGTGPFKFVSWSQGTEVNLEKNPDFWGKDLPASQYGGEPTFDQLVIRPNEDNTARVAALTGGQLTASDGLVPDDVEAVKEAGLKVDYRPPNTIGYLAMNLQKKPFDNVKVRQAINMAIDMPKIVDFALGNTAQVATTYQPPTVPFFNESIERYPYDPEKARQMLKEEGAENLETNLWYMPIPRPYMPDAKSIAQAMQEDLKKVGVKAKLVTRDWGVYLTETGSGAHDMCLLGWTADNGDPDNFLGTLLSSETATPTEALNVAYYKNPEADKLIEQGRVTIDQGKRGDIYMRLQEVINADAPWAPIAYAKPPIGLQTQVQGYQPNPTGGEPFNTITLSGGGA